MQLQDCGRTIIEKILLNGILKQKKENNSVVGEECVWYNFNLSVYPN